MSIVPGMLVTRLDSDIGLAMSITMKDRIDTNDVHTMCDRDTVAMVVAVCEEKTERADQVAYMLTPAGVDWDWIKIWYTMYVENAKTR